MTTTDTDPQTEAGRDLIAALPPTWWPVADGTFARKVRAIEAEARRLTVERLRERIETLPAIATQHSCWDDHEGGPSGPHADGTPCIDRVLWEAVDRADVLAALDQEETRA